MSQITAFKKPLLVILEEKKRIRDYNKEERLSYSFKIVNDLLLDLGVSSKSDPEQHKRLISYISEECGRYSFEEIQYAFKMVLKGYLEIDLFQQINVLVFSKVMKLYQKHKNEKLRTYRLNKPKLNLITEKEKNDLVLQAVDNQLKFFLSNRKIDVSRIYVYDVFYKLGVINKDISYKKSILKDAIEILNKEYSEKKAENKQDARKLRSIKKSLLKYDSKSSNIKSLVKLKCKELALEDYLRREVKSKLDVVRLINLFKT